MKMRQAVKIVRNLAEERRCYRLQTIARAQAVWDRHEGRSDKRLFDRIRCLVGPRGFFGFQMDLRLRNLEERFCDREGLP